MKKTGYQSEQIYKCFYGKDAPATIEENPHWQHGSVNCSREIAIGYTEDKETKKR